MNKDIVITVSRQYGSGGRELCNILANRLGVKLYDSQIIDLVAEKMGLENMSQGDIKKLGERIAPTSLKFMPFQIFGIGGNKPLNNKFFEIEAKVIDKIANEGSCIILGRCADFVLKNKKNVFSFYIHADDDFRTERGKNVYEGKTLAELKHEDKKRAEYYLYYTGRKWGDAKNYDLCINTSKISLEEAVDLIIDYVKKSK